LSIERIKQLGTSRWLLVLVLGLLFVPPYVSSGYRLLQIPSITAFIVTHAIKHNLSAIYPVFNLLAISGMIAALAGGQRWAPALAVYATLTYILSAIIQNVSISSEYGVAISISNLSLILLVAAAWLWEVLFPENDFSQRPPLKRAFPLLTLAILAIWQPVNPGTMLPDFHLGLLLTSGSSLTFCMMTTVFLGILLLYYPKVNLLTLRVTSLIGLLIGLGNLWLEFIHLPALGWVGLLHLPLVGLAALGLYLSALKSTVTTA